MRCVRLVVTIIPIEDPWLRDRNGFCPICKTNCHADTDNNREEKQSEDCASTSAERENVQLHIDTIRTELLQFSEQQSRSM